MQHVSHVTLRLPIRLSLPAVSDCPSLHPPSSPPKRLVPAMAESVRHTRLREVATRALDESLAGCSAEEFCDGFALDPVHRPMLQALHAQATAQLRENSLVRNTGAGEGARARQLMLASGQQSSAPTPLRPARRTLPRPCRPNAPRPPSSGVHRLSSTSSSASSASARACSGSSR